MPSLQVQVRDLFEVMADALVVPCNRQTTLLFGTHIAAKARQLGGAEIASARRHLGTLDFGQVGSARLTTFGGRFIIFAAVLDLFDFNPLFLVRLRWRISPDLLVQATSNILKECSRIGVTSVALPAFASGINGMSVVSCASLMNSVAITHDDICFPIILAIRNERDACRVYQVLGKQ